MRLDAESDAHAFVAARGRALYRTAFLLVGSSPYAEELTQAALITVISSWTRSTRRDGPEVAAYRILIKRAARRWRLPRPLSEPTAAGDPVIAGLQSLPLRMRAMFVLSSYDDLPEHEIAAILGVSPGTVRSELSKARSLLRTRIASDNLSASMHETVVADAATSRPLLDWSALHASSRRRLAVRRGAAVVVATALVGSAVVITPLITGDRRGYVPSGPEVPVVPGPGALLVLDEYGCPSGTTIVRASDDAGATMLIQTDQGTWVCSSTTSTTDDAVNFVSNLWDDVKVDTGDGAWLGPLELATCDGAPCGDVLWSAVSALPPGIKNVQVQVVGEDGVHEATESQSTWAIRLRRPAADNTVVSTSHVISGDTLTALISFGHTEPAADAVFTAVSANFRASCVHTLADTQFPAWTEHACTNDLLLQKLGDTAAELAFSIRFDAQCQWYAEYLVAIDGQQQKRETDALVVINNIPTWPGFAGNELGSYIAMLGDQAKVGDVSIMRQQFPPESDTEAVANCSYTYLEQARNSMS